MVNRGAMLVMLLLFTGLAAAIGAIWHQYRQTRQALGFWGAEAAYLIGQAPTVELTVLHRSATDASDLLEKANRRQRPLDISRSKGLVHFRRSLLEDDNFDWDIDGPAATLADCDYAVIFSDDQASVMLMFDLDRHLVAKQVPAGHTAVITARMAKGLAQFFEETLAQAVE